MTRARTGVQRAEDNADQWWWDCAMRAVTHLADSGRPFTANDVTLLGVPAPDHPNRWGALLRSAHTAGLIEAAGFTQSSRPSRAGGVCRVWVGRLAA